MSSEPAAAPAPRRTTTRYLIAFACLALAIDLISKITVVATLTPRRPVQIIGDTFTFTLVRNSGAAFSMATGYTWVLTIIATVVVVVIIRYSSRLRSIPWAIGLGLIVGGALGNLVDRLFRAPGPLQGHVVDFLSIGWWPVFNLADCAVVTGAVLLVTLTIFGYEFDGTRVKDKKAQEDSEQEASGA